MIHFPFVQFPVELLHLLKENIQFSTTTPATILKVIYQNPGLTKLLEQTFTEFDGQKRLEQVVRTLGWKHFRDRLCSLYIFKASHGFFPDRTDIAWVEDIKAFEEQLTPYAVNSYSRAFLLGMYLKLATIELEKQRPGSNVNYLHIPSFVMDFLRLHSSKNEKIDWLVLSVWQLLAYMKEKGVNYHQLPLDYATFYEKMDLEERRLYLRNVFQYASSVRDEVA